MAGLKPKEIREMDKKQIDKKLKELKMELVKAEISSAQGGKTRVREIKKNIARILTLNK